MQYWLRKLFIACICPGQRKALSLLRLIWRSIMIESTRISRNSLSKTLAFPNMVSIILNCVQASNLVVLWNDAQTEFFKHSRGLRQGDPLSLYLFVLFMDKLSISIK